MDLWLTRWFGSTRATPPSARVEPAPLAPAPLAPQDAGGACRRPLFNRKGELAGFEFRLAGTIAQRIQERGDVVAHAAHAGALLKAMRASLTGNRIALLSLPLSIAARPSVLEEVPPRAMLALSGGPWSAPPDLQVLAQLRRQGAQVGGLGTPLAGGQFVLIECRNRQGSALPRMLESCQRADPTCRIVATGLPNIDDLESALQNGFDLAAGDTDRSAAPPSSRALAPRLQRLCQLLNRVAGEDDLTVLARELRTEVDLVYRLLRYANSPLLGLARPADSVEQAVMLLGRDGLYRWLTFLLLSGADGRATSRALHEIALARARLLELLAPRLGAPAPSLFTTGLFSLMEVMLRMPLAEALAPLQLPQPAMQALLEHSGPWRPALDMAIALEGDDGAAIEALAQGLGGIDAVTAQAQQAWAWAADAVAQTRA